MRNRIRQVSAAVAGVVFGLAMSLHVSAGDARATTQIDLPAQPLSQAIQAVARQGSINILVDPKLVEGRKAPALKAEMSVQQALNLLLEGTGLTPRFVDEKTITLVAGDAVTKPVAGSAAAAEELWLAQITQSSTSESAESGNGSPELEEIVVTAQKRIQSVKDVPMTITAISDAALRERGIDDILDLSFAVPALTVFQSTLSGPYYALRGIGSVEGDSMVGVYLDEAPITGPTGFQLDLRTVDLERVEVLHGPQGTLYGQGSVGGTVRFITKEPDLTDLEGEVDASTSFTKGGDPSRSITGVLNVPVIKDVLAFRVAAASDYTGGYIDTSSGRENVNHQDVAYLRAKILWHPTESLNVKATGILHRNDAGFANAPQTEDRTVILPEYAPSIDLPNDNRYNLFNLVATDELPFAQLLSSTTYVDASADSAFTNFLFVTQRHAFATDSYRTFGQELRLVSSGSSRYSWTLGGAYNKSDFFEEMLFTVGLGPDILLDSLPLIKDFESRSWAAFGDANVKLTDRLSIGAGVRDFEEDKRVPEQSATFHSIDPRLYASFDLTDALRLYGNVSEGFRSGGFNAISTGVSLPRTYDPETLRSYEMGAKFARAGLPLSGELALFRSNYLDMQTQVNDPASGFTYIGNVGKARVQGIDLSMRIGLTQRLALQVSGTLTDTKVISIPDGASLAEGDRLNFIPNYSYSVSGSYDIRWLGRFDGFLRLDYNEKGKALYHLRDIGIINESQVTQLLNLRLGATYQRVALQLFADNLLDDNSQMNPSPTGFYARPRPRTVGLSATLSF
jgi:outer membrane receptor protein involved in Fe transport